MFIRQTKTSGRKNGAKYQTYRLVRSVRTPSGVRQETILNLGRYFPYPEELWPDIACRIDNLLKGQKSLFKLPNEIEVAVQRYVAQIIQKWNRGEDDSDIPDYHNVDINSIELMRPRSVGLEHICFYALRQLQLDKLFRKLKFNEHQVNAAIGVIIARMIEPGSELATHFWLQNRSALGELIVYDFEGMPLTRVYRANDQLLKYKKEIENFLYEREKSMFKFSETIALYDLTNTYFEGTCKFNDLGKRARSKEKRSDCPLVTLGIVLDGSGFPRRSEVFAGNASEPKTLEEMINGLNEESKYQPKNQKQMQLLLENPKPLIVMDAGIATEENLEWLQAKNYKYLVVSRRRYREFEESKAVEVKKDKDYIVKAYKVKNKDTNEIELYCHSTLKEGKERAIMNSFSSKFEDSLVQLNEGLSKKGYTKNYDKIMERIGRLKQRYSKAAKNYKVTIEKDENSDNAKKIIWQKIQPPDSADSYPGVYCLRANFDQWSEATLWRTYIMLTELEAVFRSLKSELGLRPIYHQRKRRVSAHLFITLIAYHLVHTIRYQLKRKNFNYAWSSIKKRLRGQDRITTRIRTQNGETIHIRKSTRPETMQTEIYDILEINHYPGGLVKTIVK